MREDIEVVIVQPTQHPCADFLRRQCQTWVRAGRNRQAVGLEETLGEYCIWTRWSRTNTGKLWLAEPDGHRRQLDDSLNYPTGVALTPDNQWLAVAEGKSHWGYNYRVLPDGSVQDKQRFYWFHVPDEADDSGAEAWVADRDGRLYAATRMGVQVFDRNGRVRAILPVPGGAVRGLVFAGEHFDTLYVTCADHRVYYRSLKVTGAPSRSRPTPLPVGRPG